MYGESRLAKKQKPRTAKCHAKTKGRATRLAARPLGEAANREKKRCLAKGGAKSALKHYATDVYAKLDKYLAKQSDEFFTPAGGAVGS